MAKRISIVVAAAMLIMFSAFHSSGYAADTSTKEILALEHIVKVQQAESLAWSPSGEYLAVQGYSPLVKIFDANAKEIPLADTASGKGSPSHQNVAYSPDGRWLAAGLNSIIVWDTKTGHIAKRITGPHLDLSRKMSSIVRFAFSPDSSNIAVAYEIQEERKAPLIQIVLYEVDASTPIWSRDLNGDSGIRPITTPIAFTPDGKFLVLGVYEHRPSPTDWERQSAVLVLDGKSGETAKIIKNVQSDLLSALAVSRDGRLIATSTQTGSIDQTRSLTYKVVHTLNNKDPVRVWDLVTGKLLKELSVEHRPWSLAFSPDGTYLVSGTNIGIYPRDKLVLQIWKWDTGELVQRLEMSNSGDAPFSMAFDPDGKRLAIAAGNNVMWLRVKAP